MAVKTGEDDMTGMLDATTEGVEREALRYQVFCADQLLARVHPRPGSRLLDVCAGSGFMAVGAAQALAPAGRVTAIDQSGKLLARLEAKIGQFGIPNIDIHVMDGARLDFRRDYFQYVLCSLGLYRFANVLAALGEWRRVLAAGGQFGCATLAAGAFQPQLGLLLQRLARAGMRPDPPWATTADRSALLHQLQTSGFTDIVLHEAQLGYHLDKVELWWDVIEFSPLRACLEPLSHAQRQQLRLAHLDEVASLSGAQGLWLEVPVLFALARKPGG